MQISNLVPVHNQTFEGSESSNAAPMPEPAGSRLGVCVSSVLTQKSPVGAQTPYDRAFPFNPTENEVRSMQTKIQAHVRSVQIARRIGHLSGAERQQAIAGFCQQLRIMLGVRV